MGRSEERLEARPALGLPLYHMPGYPWSPIVSLIVMSESQVFSSLS